MQNIHDVRSDWKEVMLKMYREGASDTEVRAELGVTVRFWKQQMLDPAFEDVVTYGHTLSQAWWMKQGRLNLGNKSFNAQLYNINMQNRFGWNDKSRTVSGEDEEDYEREEDIQAEIEQLTSRATVN